MSTIRTLGRGYVDNVEMVSTELHVDHGVETIWSRGPRLDEGWSYVDGQGHFHAYDAADKVFPTLLATSIDRPCDGSCGGVCGGEGYSVTQYTCRICSEEIEPSLIHGEYSTTIPGRSSWEAKVSGSRPLPMGLVSFRLSTDQSEVFGIAQVTDVTSSINGLFTCGLYGVSRLGRRKPARDSALATS